MIDISYGHERVVASHPCNADEPQGGVASRRCGAKLAAAALGATPKEADVLHAAQCWPSQRVSDSTATQRPLRPCAHKQGRPVPRTFFAHFAFGGRADAAFATLIARAC